MAKQSIPQCTKKLRKAKEMPRNLQEESNVSVPPPPTDDHLETSRGGEHYVPMPDVRL
ncbi:MAG: hypothetical protein AAB552_03080 [Patescibacteria group bacterium]